MKHLLISCALVAVFSCLASGAVITFDDLSGSIAPIPSNYAGITWDSEWYFWTGDGSTFIPLSAPNLAYFNTTNDGGFDFPSPVAFDGAWFDGNGSDTVQFNMYLSGSLVASSAILAANPGAMVFLASGYSGPVDRVQVDIVGNLDGWTLDNVTYNSGVPEPATFGLFAIGAGVLFALRRKAV